MPYKSYAEFARTKGAKDKGQRKSRAKELYDSAVSRASTGLRNAYVGAVDSAAGAYARGKYGQVKEGTRSRANDLYARGKISAQALRDRANNNRGAIAGGVAGAAALGAGARYGGAALAYRRAGQMQPLDKVMKKGGSQAQRAAKTLSEGGALGKLGRDAGRIFGTTTKGRILRGGGLIGAAGGTAAVMKYLKNRKKRQQMEG